MDRIVTIAKRVAQGLPTPSSQLAEVIANEAVEVLTKGFLAPDIAERAEADLLPIP